MHNTDKSSKKYTIKDIFYRVQHSKSDHPKYKKLLTDIFKKSNFDDFLEEFIQCIKICLLHDEKSANVERTLDFAADFTVSFTSGLKEDESCPLLEGVFRFIFENHDSHIQLVRLRICQLMNRILDNMGHDATVEEETYNKIAESMLVRLRDCMSSVRAQAVYALHRLQSPSDPQCDITKAFMFHMTHDPCHEVRRAAMQKIVINKVTLAAILTRMNDVKDTVRKEAYVVINRFLIRQFTIKQRQLILESALWERSEIVHDYAINVLIPNWLKFFNFNFYDFLECIHIEQIPDTALKLLKKLFLKQHDVVLEARVSNMGIINKKIAYNKLNVISVLYWRALVEFAKPSNDNDTHEYEHIFEEVLPDLTPFCQYIREYFFPPDDVKQSSSDTEPSLGKEQITENLDSPHKEGETPTRLSNVNKSVDGNQKTKIEISNSGNSPEESKKEESKSEEKTSPDQKKESNKSCHVPNETVLVHLLEMCRVYDLSDEMGRSSLQQLCVDFLQSPSVTLISTGTLASLLDHVVPSVQAKLTAMTEVITELREPLQATSETSIYVPDLLLLEAQEKKIELENKIADLEAEMEIVQELGDIERLEEIKITKAKLKKELKIMNSITPQDDEPGRNTRNDPATLKKCLTIVVEVMNKGKIRKMNPTLYSLLHNFIIPTLNLRIEGGGSSLVKNLALQALGIFCVLDTTLAKEHFMMFCFNIANELLAVTALKCVFDLLHVYGLATFNIEDPDEMSITNATEDEGSHRPNLIVLLMSLLSSKSLEMKKTAVIGMGKLLLAGRIKSPGLVSKLIILWYSPEVESEPHIRQPLGVFFRIFAESCPYAPQLLVKAFIPTVKEFFRLETVDPLQEVDIESPANLLVEFTRPSMCTYASKEYSAHNLIAMSICEEILSEELETPNCLVLAKVLNHLDLNFDLTSDINVLSALVSRVVKSTVKEDKTLHRLMMKFDIRLQMGQEGNKTTSTLDNTLLADGNVDVSQLLLSTREDTESESETEQEDEELSQDEMTFQTVDVSEDMVIPSTPESTDSESDSDSRDSGPPLVKSAKTSGASDFKEPIAPPLRTPAKTPAKPSRTPAKTPFKAPSKTPGKSSQTPAKRSVSSSTKSKNDSINSSLQSRKTPFKGGKTPSDRSSTDSTKTPAKHGQSTKTPAKNVPVNQIPGEDEDSQTSGRITRSAKKLKP